MKTLLFIFALCLPLTAGAQYGPRIVTPAASPSPGASAYDVAVANGFVGTPVQWLASLQGANATTTANATGTSAGLMSPTSFTLLSSALQSVPAQSWTSITGKPTFFDGTWPSLTGKPTTLAGYGITDAAPASPSRLSTTGNVPTLSMLTAAGTGSSATITGTNLSGTITMTSGVSLLSTGGVMTLTFADGFSFPSGCAVVFSPANANFASVYTKLYATPVVTGGRCTGVTINTALALSIGTVYAGTYVIVGW